MRGRGTVMLEWSWRVEGPRSIRFGSWSSDRKLSNGLVRLRGQRVIGICLEGRLPEIVVALSRRTWVHSFSTVEGQPDWTLFLPNGECVSVVGGRVKRLR